MYRIHLIIVHENYENDEAETVPTTFVALTPPL